MRTANVALGALLFVFVVLGSAQAQVAYSTNQLETSALVERAQRALFPGTANSYVLPTATGLPTSNVVDNAAARQLQADKSAFPFLATLPNGGSAAFFTALKSCGMILPHVHPRATENYVIISGQMIGGVAEENGGRQNLTFPVYAGQNMVVPQGLVHYNQNPTCSPTVFIQTFNSADPGNVGLQGALSGLAAANPQVSSANAGNFTLTASPQGGFALDKTCLSACGLPATGAPGNGLSGLSQELQVFLGLAGSPASGPTGPTAG